MFKVNLPMTDFLEKSSSASQPPAVFFQSEEMTKRAVFPDTFTLVIFMEVKCGCCYADLKSNIADRVVGIKTYRFKETRHKFSLFPRLERLSLLGTQKHFKTQTQTQALQVNDLNVDPSLPSRPDVLSRWCFSLTRWMCL